MSPELDVAFLKETFRLFRNHLDFAEYSWKRQGKIKLEVIILYRTKVQSQTLRQLRHSMSP